MNITRLEYWRLRSERQFSDQHPGCHTHASGFDYVAIYTEADEAVDAMWERERQQKHQKLLRVRGD